jgi:formate hydrogenlyase subunit 3/multisubunit Na+/H+ antiporter MnhD subunit
MIPYILAQIVLVPALVALVLFLFRRRIGRGSGSVAAAGLAYTTLLLLIALYEVYHGGPIREDYPILINPDIRIGFLADGLSIAVALICNLLSLALCIYSIPYVAYRIETIYPEADGDSKRGYFSAFFYLFLFFPLGFMGVSFATDLVALYFFMEVLTITLFFLMAQFGYYERVKIAMMSLVWGIFSALVFLAGVVIVYAEVGSFQIDQIQAMAGTPMAFWAIAVILLGMFAKLAIVPMHVWMPWVHAEHPTCIAGLLAVYANIAAYVIVRVLVLPLFDDFQWFAAPIMILAVITMIYGALLTLAQTDMKRIPACSTISQCAYSMLGIGAVTAAGIEGGLFFFLSHIMGKTVFFSACGIVVYMTHVRNIDALGGLAKKMPLTALLFVAGAMMLAGIPPFSSFAAELIMFRGILERGDTLGIVAAVGGFIGVLLTLTYASYFSLRIFFVGPPPPRLDDDASIQDPPWSMSLPLLGIVVLGAFLGLFPWIVLDLFEPVISAAVAGP